MPKGGRRPGAGRPAGAATVKTREIAERAIRSGVTPLEVMLDTMRKLVTEGNMVEACNIAKDCAPYIHPRLSAVEATVDGSMGLYEAVRIPVEDREPIPE